MCQREMNADNNATASGMATFTLLSARLQFIRQTSEATNLSMQFTLKRSQPIRHDYQ